MPTTEKMRGETFENWFATLASKDARVVPHEMFMLESWMAGQREVANDSLRAAAPALYAALEEMVNQAMNWFDQEPAELQTALRNARSALAAVQPSEVEK